MKTEIITEDWPNGHMKYEIPHVNGKRHGLARWWYKNGQKELIISFVNGQEHGLTIWWHNDGSLEYLGNWYKDQVVWAIKFTSEEQIPGDAEVELFFHPTPELS